MNSQTKRISKKISKTLEYMDLKGLNKYIDDKYGKLLTIYSEGKTDLQIRSMIDAFADEEIVFLSGVPESEIPIALIPDRGLNGLIGLSADIFEEARTCLKRGITLSDSKQYEKKVLALSNYMDEVKPHNYYTARTFYSAAILDLNYMYGKSNSMSLRLASVE